MDKNRPSTWRDKHLDDAHLDIDIDYNGGRTPPLDYPEHHPYGRKPQPPRPDPGFNRGILIGLGIMAGWVGLCSFVIWLVR